METFAVLLALTKVSDAELWCFNWINGCVNNRNADDLRRHRAHYDVIVMLLQDKWEQSQTVCECVIMQRFVSMVGRFQVTRGQI